MSDSEHPATHASAVLEHVVKSVVGDPDAVKVNAAADGDTVAAGDPILTIETDKVETDVDSPEGGILRHHGEVVIDRAIGYARGNVPGERFEPDAAVPMRTDTPVNGVIDELERRRDVLTLDAYAWALFRNGRIDEAWTAIESALAPGVQNAQLFDHAAQIAAARGDDAEFQRYSKRSADLH